MRMFDGRLYFKTNPHTLPEDLKYEVTVLLIEKADFEEVPRSSAKYSER